MRDAVIVGAVRTPIGKRNGMLADLHPVDLASAVLSELVSRTGIEPELVEDVIFGCVSQVGEQSSNVARLAALAAGWPVGVPGVTVDRACGSSQQALHFAAAAVIAGQYDLVVAGGVESMSRVPMASARRSGPGLPYGPRLRSRFSDALGDSGEFQQGHAAELIAQRWGLSRTRLDEYSLASHDAAARALDSGAFAGELIGLDGLQADVAAADEGVRRDTSMDRLAGLKSPFWPDTGVVTAGNSSQISDGAAAVLITTSERAAVLGIKPLARFHGFAAAGVDPVLMLTGPIPATLDVLRRTRLTPDDIDHYEVNEAFASVVCAWLDETGADPATVNPLGGAIALGHPLGASGARLVTTAVHRLNSAGMRYALVTMCEGGGMANATVLESLSA